MVGLHTNGAVDMRCPGSNTLTNASRRVGFLLFSLCAAVALAACSPDVVTAPPQSAPSLQLEGEEAVCVKKGEDGAPSDTTAVLADGSCQAGYDHTPWW
jgi:hypothetical protein